MPYSVNPFTGQLDGTKLTNKISMANGDVIFEWDGVNTLSLKIFGQTIQTWKVHISQLLTEGGVGLTTESGDELIEE